VRNALGKKRDRGVRYLPQPGRLTQRPELVLKKIGRKHLIEVTLPGKRKWFVRKGCLPEGLKGGPPADHRSKKGVRKTGWDRSGNTQRETEKVPEWGRGLQKNMVERRLHVSPEKTNGFKSRRFESLEGGKGPGEMTSDVKWSDRFQGGSEKGSGV